MRHEIENSPDHLLTNKECCTALPKKLGVLGD